MTRKFLRRIVEKIGESPKKGLTWVNGRFGFGVHAFRAAARRIRFRTKHADDACIELQFTKEQLTGLNPPAESPGPFPTPTGTVVTISEFDRDWLQELTADAVRREIELHFERLLARPNLRVEVSQDGGAPVRCRPFNYDSYIGTEVSRSLTVGYGGKEYPIEVRLKVCERAVPEFAPRFFGRGRRVNEVQAIKSFMSKSRYRTAVWGHEHLVGYIEVGEAVAPVITRDDFERSVVRSMVYDQLLPLEAQLKEALDAVNKQQGDRRLSRLEDVLRDTLSKIAREDALQFRTEVAGKGTEVPSLPGGAVAGSETGAPVGESNGSDSGDGGGGEGGGTGTSGAGAGNLPGAGTGGCCPDPDPAATTPNAATRRKSGFDIKFQPLPEDVNGRIFRSKFLDGTIFLNTDHPDSKDRVRYTRQGGLQLTPRLVGYLAQVISVHYKDQYYEKYRNEPDRRDQLFAEQVDFICRLESGLHSQSDALQTQLSNDSAQEGGHGD